MLAPSTRDVENSLEILENLSVFSDQMQDLIDKFETLLREIKYKSPCK